MVSAKAVWQYKKRKNFEHAIVDFEYSDATKVLRFVKHFCKVKTRFFFTCELKQ